MTESENKTPGKLKLGDGEFWKPGVAEAALYDARCLFLETIRTSVPDVLSDLARHVFPFYLTSKNWQPSPSEMFRKRPAYAVALEIEKNGDFADYFTAWADCYSINIPWIEETALHTLKMWVESKPDDRWHFPPRPQSSEEGLTLPFKFHYKPPRLTEVTLKDLETNLRAEFEAWLKRYREDMVRRYKTAGYVRTIRKNTRTADDHFQWLALFQVKRVSYEKIQNQWEKNSTPQMVEQAIKRTAKFIDLPLRKWSNKDLEDRTIYFPPYRKRHRLWESDQLSTIP